MSTFLTLLIIVLVILVIVSLVRGIMAFLKSTRMDLERDDGEGPSAMQIRQNKMMFSRIKYQTLAVIVVAVLIMASR